MARAASAPKKEISMEEALWKSADNSVVLSSQQNINTSFSVSSF